MPIARDNTLYTVVPQNDGTFGVQIVRPHQLPAMMGGFESEEEAQEWIYTHIAPMGPGLPDYAPQT